MSSDRPARMDERLTRQQWREILGLQVRLAWVRWARTQPDPKPSWLVPYDRLSESDKEADRQIGEHIAEFVMQFVGTEQCTVNLVEPDGSGRCAECGQVHGIHRS